MSLNDLSLCTSLTSLYCVIEARPPLQSEPPWGSVYLPYLQHLILNADPSHSATFFSSITTPSLKQVELSIGFLWDEGVAGETWTSAFVNLAKRSSFNLVNISLQQQYGYDTDILEMHRQLSSTNSIEFINILSAPANRFTLSDCMMELLTINVDEDKEKQKSIFLC